MLYFELHVDITILNTAVTNVFNFSVNDYHK